MDSNKDDSDMMVKSGVNKNNHRGDENQICNEAEAGATARQGDGNNFEMEEEFNTSTDEEYDPKVK